LSPIRTKAYHFAVGAVLAGLTALTVRAESLKERLQMCFDCHGENGQSQRPEVPSLGEQFRAEATTRRCRKSSIR